MPAHANAETNIKRRHGDPDSRTNTHASVNACNSAQNASIVPESEHTLGAAKHIRDCLVEIGAQCFLTLVPVPPLWMVVS